MKRFRLLACGSLLAALTLGVRAEDPDPTVDILGFMDWTADGLMAIVVPDDQDTWHGAFDFWASVNDAPTERAECQLSGPTYDWQFVASAEGALISPPDEESTTLTLDDEVNWGTTYTLSVTVIWQETGPTWAGPRGEIRATNTIQIAAMKVTADDIGNLCTKGPHSGHQVYVEITPGDLGIPLELELSSDGEGSATFMENGDTKLTITESQWVPIEGWVASDLMDDMTLSGSFGSGTAFTKTFTIYDVDQLMAREQLHENNAATSGAEDDGTVLDVCQEADGGARLLFNLDFWPWDAEGSKFLWDLVRADDETVADEWAAQSGDFGEGEVSVAWNPDDPPATREFYLRTWFDCEETGEFDDTAPYRKVKIRVVDLDTLTLTALKSDSSVMDTTRDNEERAQNNTLYVAEETNGTAQVMMDLSWLPEGVDGSKFHFQILPEGEDMPSAQWDLADGTFEESSITVTWTQGAGGESNRVFTVNAWFDCNGNGEQNDDEPCRQLFIMVAKANYALDHVCPKGPHHPHIVNVTVEPRNESVPLTVELGRIAGLGSSGAAVFQDNNSSALSLEITGSNTVTIMGTQYSDQLTNMFMTAAISGAVCASNVFTVYDVDKLTAIEDLHANNTVTSTQENDGKVLDICQGPGPDGAAVLNSTLLFYPTNDNRQLFLSDITLLDGTAETNQWYPAQYWFVNGETNQAIWTLPVTGPTNREFLLHGWFDCDDHGVYSNIYPHRDIKVRVVDLDKLTLTALTDNSSVADMTRTNEPMSASNTLYLAEGTNGVAQMKIESSWLPTGIPADRFCYEILLPNSATSAQWQASSGAFGQNPVTVTWTNCANGETNRVFKVNAWYDCNHNGTNDVNEPHRQLFVTILKLKSVELVSGATSNNVPPPHTWAAVKNTNSPTEYVLVRAIIEPALDPALLPPGFITWSGGEAVTSNQFQRKAPKNVSTHSELVATCGGSSATGQVWILWGSVEILISGTNSPHAPTFPSYEPGDQLGVQYSSSTNSAWGKICAVATITPAGVHTVITNGWDLFQKRMSHDFNDGTKSSKYYDTTWQPDGPRDLYKQIVPDSNENLYAIDGPNIAGFGTNSAETYNNFYVYFEWNSQLCCDTNSFWYWQGRWKANQTPQITFADLGTSALNLPTNSFYSPPP